MEYAVRKNKFPEDILYERRDSVQPGGGMLHEAERAHEFFY